MSAMASTPAWARVAIAVALASLLTPLLRCGALGFLGLVPLAAALGALAADPRPRAGLVLAAGAAPCAALLFGRAALELRMSPACPLLLALAAATLAAPGALRARADGRRCVVLRGVLAALVTLLGLGASRAALHTRAFGPISPLKVLVAAPALTASVALGLALASWPRRPMRPLAHPSPRRLP